MGGSSGSSTTNQSSVQQQQLPPWVNQAAEQNYAFAQNVANRPLQQYQGQQVADVGNQMQQAWDLAANSGNAGGPQYQEAEAGYLGNLGSAAPTVTPQTVAGTNLQPYMNPYTQSVINTTLPLMQQQLNLAKQGIGDQATQANAFGGSRQGVEAGVADSQGALNMANMAAGLNQANFGQAQTAATGDVTRDLTAQQSNQAANLTQEQVGNQAASGLTALGQQAQTNQARQFSELTTAGALEQQQAQNEINANMNQYNQAWNYPTTQMSTLLSALGMTPYGQTSVGQSSGTTTTNYTPDLAMTALGGLQTLGGLFSAPAGGTSAISGLLALSDSDLKTDIARVDTHPSGLPIYSYRYKGDPKSYPKVVGPMAEDVMKVAPHAVRPMGAGGRLGVDMGALDATMRPVTAPPATPAPMMGAARGLAGIMPRINPPGLPPSPTSGGPTGTPRGAPMGGGPIPGGLAGGGPMGTIGALGSTLRPPRVRRPGMPGMARGALVGL
jgi:Chaperone of endosialidase